MTCRHRITIATLESGDMTLCMTLSGHTSTLPRPIVWGAGFQGHFLDLTKAQKSTGTGTYVNRGRDIILVERH